MPPVGLARSVYPLCVGIEIAWAERVLAQQTATVGWSPLNSPTRPVCFVEQNDDRTRDMAEWFDKIVRAFAF